MYSKEPFIELPKPSSLLLKRLTDPKKNLTIRTPAYTNESDNFMIHSAPLRKMVTKKTIMKHHHHPATPVVPSHASSSSRQKQLFLQPFEYLYDNLEQTRKLKMTLDDEIRRSANLVQTLQSSTDLIESLVRKYVHEMMDPRLENHLKKCEERIASLERRITFQTIPSPASSPTTSDKKKDLLVQLLDRMDTLESKLNKTL
ncbi:hypothetical protein G6F57_003948 [Rhizopus arrhizus]|uniref:Uncharacterized protein n=1 Tax=Rhizopus oryzae TaxID=64495 RepID=A0A9P7BUW7_RHIOR|nr:hypothetical protein G6F23_003379 [Rhizopus arrhizus]KAG1254183.1 hypothetical protein G6F68_010974 [Rhizopus microsporus]KAG1425801.1 hypothetical protein G6F58_001779 [Rhizopus delemar]KAG0766452.1 hypothetical protein G6F24_003597 [Rhizopus arrhizus]KAG0793222.1 hypothetical protein G6F21_003779 [Rhizopus arrhizus]